MKTLLAVASLLVLFSPVLANNSHELRSPDNRIVVTVRVEDQISYDVQVNGKGLVKDSTLSLDVDHKKLGHDAKLDTVKNDSVDREIEPPVKHKFAKIRE